MKKSLAIVTSALLALIVAANITGYQGFAVDILTNPEPLHHIARIAAIAGLLTIAFTQRPRSKFVRESLTVVSALVTSIAVYFVLANELALGDAMLYVISSIVIMMEAIEEAPVPMAHEGKLRSSSQS